MAELRFMILVRREGQPVHDSDKFATEEYEDAEGLLDAVNHYVRVQLEDEEINGSEYSSRNEGDDE